MTIHFNPGAVGCFLAKNHRLRKKAIAPGLNDLQSLKNRGFAGMKTAASHRALRGSVEGGAIRMIFDSFDCEMLKLCGLCRYIPQGLSVRYDTPIFTRSVILNLQEHGLIRLQSDAMSYKLTSIGRRYLADMGYEFSDDARLSVKKQGFRRKLVGAQWNVLLYLAGINVFLKHSAELAGMKTGYISSLMMRSRNNIRVLAGTRFFGLLKIDNTVYVPYNIESENDWIIPIHEKEVFESQLENAGEIKNLRIILLGNTLEELWSFLHPKVKGKKMSYGQKRFPDALEILGFETLLVPLTKSGVMQMSLLKLEEYRRRIAKAIGCDVLQVPHLSECDGMLNGIPYIIAIDCNTERIVRALKQIELMRSSVIPKICCLPFQKNIIFQILALHNCQKSVVVTLDKDNIYKIFPELIENIPKREPVQTKEGDYIEVYQRNYKKDDTEA